VWGIEECQSSCAVRAVLEQCHAQRQCSLLATEAIFGKACRSDTAKYLSVVYACGKTRSYLYIATTTVILYKQFTGIMFSLIAVFQMLIQE
jgi:hypothetical protein